MRQYIAPKIKIIELQNEKMFCYSGVANGPHGGVVYKDEYGYWSWDKVTGGKIRSDDYNWLDKKSAHWHYSNYAKSAELWDDI